ncbi:carbohydrate ABC transporter permease [Lysobacter korlensis]|uniref:Carbohydrate ABC transporter permease n=1 Tax=Lysobacter korlensis TaxID=553636 RepID=A0ABV6RX56_9GAMM
MFRYTKWTLVREIVVILGAIVMLLPFYFLFSTALKPREEVLTTPAIQPPTAPTLDGLFEIFGGTGRSSISVGMMNSVIITAGAIFGLVLLGSLCAYVLSRKFSRFSTVAYYMILVGIIVPAQLGTIPIYVGARALGMVGSLWGMIILYVGMLMPLAVFLYAGFIRALPKEYEEASTIDGASKFQIFVRVVFPLLAPATGTVAILTGLAVWNDFFTPLIFLDGSEAATLPVVMFGYVGSIVSRWDLIFWVVIVSMLPILIFYLFAQKKFIQGFSGGIKS